MIAKLKNAIRTTNVEVAKLKAILSPGVLTSITTKGISRRVNQPPETRSNTGNGGGARWA